MAKYFKDSKGDEWEIAITVTVIKRIRDRSAETINLFEPGEPENKPVSQLLWTDTLLFYDVLYWLMLPELDKKDIDEEEFGKRMADDCLIRACDLFYEEWASFLRALRKHAEALIVEVAAKTMLRAQERIRDKIADDNLLTRATARSEREVSDAFSKSQEQLDKILDP